MAERSSRAISYPPGYQDAVRATAAAFNRGEESNWEVCNRTLSVCGEPSGRGNGSRISLKQWAEDVQRESNRQFSATTANYYRACAIYRNTHPDEQLTFHETMDLVRTSTSAERWDESHLRGIGLAAPEVRQEAFVRLSRDPDLAPTVARVLGEVAASDASVATSLVHTIAQQQPDAVTAAYAADPQTHLAIGRATRVHDEQALRERNEHVERITNETPSLQRYGELRAITDLQEAVDQMTAIARRINTDILPRTGDLPPADADAMGMRVWLRSALVDCYQALEPIRILVATGRSDLDTFLADVLNQTA